MLHFNFERLIKIRGIEKPFSNLRKLGYSANFATKVIHNRHRRFSLNEIEQLCEIFKCTPNDLLQWVPDSPDQDNGNHPLSSLKRNNKDDILSILQTTFKNAPLDKVDELAALMNKEIQKINEAPQ